MDKFKNKYRIPSARATWWNYGWAGAYFITICTKNRNHYFGEIISESSVHPRNKMILSNCGILADVFWHEILKHAKNVELGAFTVMPNHIHGILILNSDSDTLVDSPLDPQSSLDSLLDSEPKKSFSEMRHQSQGSNTVSSIIGSYKSVVTRHANRLGLEFGWQPRFHDHIIRDDAEFQRINDYIESNVDKWNVDKFFKNQ